MLEFIKKIAGIPTINPFLFYSGKASGYILWLWYLVCLSGESATGQYGFITILHIILALSGMAVVAVSSLNLGRSTRLGLPREDTQLVTHGMFRISRNPIYLAFFMFSLAGVLCIWNVVALVLALYSTVVYHFIILREEEFLEKRFGQEYIDYKKRVNRYL